MLPGVKSFAMADGRTPWPMEVDAALLEAGGVDVGQVVGDGVDVHLLGYHARRGGEQRSDHDGSPL